MANSFPNCVYRLRRFKRQLSCSVARRFEIFAPLISTRVPVHLKHYECGKPSNELLVFLPGIGDLMEDYELNGFIEAGRRTETAIDMIVADMHFGYYLARTVVERLHDDIVLPARESGYGRISIAGISLGGFGALYYAMHHPTDIGQLFLLAPYLGDTKIIDEISMAGNLKEWNPKQIAENDYQRRLWQWLKNYDPATIGLPKLYLGYGLQDNFAAANELLAQLLPPQRTWVLPGRHDWTTWSRLWSNFFMQGSDV
jgi:pimeloyl-ACP methyl ester carboxylesterase